MIIRKKPKLDEVNRNLLESRLLSFLKKINEVESKDLSIWGGLSSTMMHLMSNDLMGELEKFGISTITLGVNLGCYCAFAPELLKSHIAYHEKKFLELTTLPLKSLAIPNIFNILGKPYEDEIIPITAYRIGYNVHQVIKMLDVHKRNTVLEIGGGFGMAASILTKNMPNTCYIIIDIPATSLLSAYFLIRLGKKVCLLGEFDKWDNNLVNEYDVIILSPDFIDKFDTNFIDIALNTASMNEMSEDSINYYVENISKIAKCFYSDNHTMLSHLAVENAFEKYLNPNFITLLNRETPIDYNYGLWPYDIFYEKMFQKLGTE
jgi:hypothetical protein